MVDVPERDQLHLHAARTLPPAHRRRDAVRPLVLRLAFAAVTRTPRQRVQHRAWASSGAVVDGRLIGGAVYLEDAGVVLAVAGGAVGEGGVDGWSHAGSAGVRRNGVDDVRSVAGQGPTESDTNTARGAVRRLASQSACAVQVDVHVSCLHTRSSLHRWNVPWRTHAHHARSPAP